MSRTRNTMINIIAWILTITGSIAFVAAAIGVVYALFLPEKGATQIASSLQLHDTYYIIHHGKVIVWAWLLCMALSAAITILGYVNTNSYVLRILRQQTSSAAKA